MILSSVKKKRRASNVTQITFDKMTKVRLRKIGDIFVIKSRLYKTF